MKKICLSMIVKNESDIIVRCLDSVKSIIDFVFICDTGSTDGTQAIIEEWLHNNQVTGTVFEEAFQNFGYNRTSALNKAKEHYPDADYILLMDADEILEISPTFNKENLKADCYLAMQYNSQIKYWYTRLIKTTLPMACVGVTHEYWHAEGIYQKDKLDTLIVNDKGDGGSKQDKFIRDEKLLLEALNDPTVTGMLRTRYLFYLGNTYHDSEQPESAIVWYHKRIEAKGWEEEVYYSYYRIGLCYKKLYNKQITLAEKEHYFALATSYFSQAWNYRPTRAEPLYELASLYRMEKQYHLATLFAKKGIEIPFPKQDVLFISYPVYDYLLKYELSISGYYADRKAGLKAQKFLETKPNLPEYVKRSVANNAKHYETKKKTN